MKNTTELQALTLLLTIFLVSGEALPEQVPLITTILYSNNEDKISSDLILSLSNLLSYDNIRGEARVSLEERLTMEKLKERREILALYPTPKLDGTGRYRARPYGKGNRKELVKPTLKEWEDAIIEYHHQQEKKELSLIEILEAYNDSRQDLSDNTIVHNIQDMKRFAGELINRPISSITALEIQKAYVSAIIATKATVKACNNYKGLLRRVFKFAKKHLGCTTIDINDCIEDLNTGVNRAIIYKPVSKQLFDYPTDRYTKDEAIALIEEVKARDTLKAYACVLALFTGQRIGEIVGLFKEDIDLENHIIYVRHSAKVNKLTNEYYIGTPKMQKNRVIVYPDIAHPIIQRIFQLSEPDSVYLFTDNSSCRRCDWLTARKVDNELRKINIVINTQNNKSEHDLRRTYDSILDEALMSSALRHLLLGHELAGIESSYLRDSHTLDEVRQTVNSAFEKFFGYKMATV